MIKEGEKRAMGVTGNRADGGAVGRPTEVGWADEGRGGMGYRRKSLRNERINYRAG